MIIKRNKTDDERQIREDFLQSGGIALTVYVMDTLLAKSPKDMDELYAPLRWLSSLLIEVLKPRFSSSAVNEQLKQLCVNLVTNLCDREDIEPGFLDEDMLITASNTCRLIAGILYNHEIDYSYSRGKGPTFSGLVNLLIHPSVIGVENNDVHGEGVDFFAWLVRFSRLLLLATGKRTLRSRCGKYISSAVRALLDAVQQDSERKPTSRFAVAYPPPPPPLPPSFSYTNSPCWTSSACVKLIKHLHDTKLPECLEKLYAKEIEESTLEERSELSELLRILSAHVTSRESSPVALPERDPIGIMELS